MSILFYLLSIVTANVVTAAVMPFHLGALIIPAGSLIVGLTFILRDYVQKQHGRAKTYAIISFALMLSALSSYLLGDTLIIVLASAIAFLVSETTDTEIYSRLKLPFSMRVLYSGLVGGFLDSVLFVIIGLSPLGAGFLTWEMVPLAILGQILAKFLLQGLGVIVIKGIEKKTLNQPSSV
ncbi:VUT family protein [Ammoniphilus sp. CFH 90114]|uniref:VUT family protein n=1 Tax=Ammoniphilus sp. CFH 90114 TaxID=2493665 RepID=UPI00100F268C|nr:VUT family protein [Ammoniphilus sp. CFH 90114]RXT13747.1 VUT family protein [Ammoniphilus sp. CFH 90114]